MNIHKNARLTFARRLEMVHQMCEQGVSPSTAANLHAVSAATARKWMGRYLAHGQVGLRDRSSRPAHSPRSVSPATALAIMELRRRCLTQARIALSLGVSKSTVSRVLARAGLSRLRDLEPPEPIHRYEHAAPGDLLHIDTKKLGRIEAPGHRVTGDRRHYSRGAGWEVLFVAVDDHARIGFTDLYPDEKKQSAVQFLYNTHAYFKSLGVHLKRLLTDNGPAFHSDAFARACESLGLKHSFTRAYRPQTNGKAERFIQSALRECAYGFVYQHSSQRAQMFDAWIHHYNWHRPHQGIGGIAPMTRLKHSTNNLLTLHT
jgi:transposase InsO family protein